MPSPCETLLEIDKKAFDLAVKRKRLLDTGTVTRPDDRLYRKDHDAIKGLTPWPTEQAAKMADFSARVSRSGGSMARELIDLKTA